MAIIQDAYVSEEIHQLKAEANGKFTAKHYDAALSTYLDLLAKLPPREATSDPEPCTSASEVHATEGTTSNDKSSEETDAASQTRSSPVAETEEQEQIRLFRSVIYANIAATHLRLEQYRDAVKACNQSLLDQPNYVKALYRRAQANEQIGGWSAYSSAVQDNKLLLTLPDLPAPTKPQVVAAIERLEAKAQEAAEKEKDEMISKLKGLGDSILGNFGWSTNNFNFTQQPGGGYSINFAP